MDQIPQQLVIGLSVGATYALIALGYTMVYGVLKLINFAHGEVYMVGAVSGWYICDAMARADAPIWLTLVVTFVGAILICSLLGFAIEFLAYRPLRNSPRLVALITAIGVSLLLQNIALIRGVFGPTPRYYDRRITDSLNAPLIGQGDGELIINLSVFDGLSLLISILLMIGLTWIVYRTRRGMALRAVSHRVDTASLMGIDGNRIISFTFMIGSALAAVAGVLNGMAYKVEPQMGLLFGLKAFIAAVLGGIGSIPGALVGGLLIGLAETFVKSYISTNYADVFVFMMLIVILLVRPTGLFGKLQPEKV